MSYPEDYFEGLAGLGDLTDAERKRSSYATTRSGADCPRATSAVTSA